MKIQILENFRKSNKIDNFAKLSFFLTLPLLPVTMVHSLSFSLLFWLPKALEKSNTNFNLKFIFFLIFLIFDVVEIKTKCTKK